MLESEPVPEPVVLPLVLPVPVVPVPPMPEPVLPVDVPDEPASEGLVELPVPVPVVLDDVPDVVPEPVAGVDEPGALVELSVLRLHAPSAARLSTRTAVRRKCVEEFFMMIPFKKMKLN